MDTTQSKKLNVAQEYFRAQEEVADQLTFASWMSRTADNISLHFVGDTPHLECLERFISSNEFAVFTGVLIIANTVFIGYTSNEVMDRTVQDYESRVAHNGAVSRRSEPEWQGTVDFVFSMAFLVELLLRILAYEWRFIFGNERAWNLLDTLLVLTSFLEFAFLGSGLLFTRVQLLLRMVRTLRLVRVFRHFMNFRQLRLMMLAIKSSFVALIWAIMLLFIMIFMFSVIFILAVANHISEAQADDPSVEDLRIFFASMPMTVLSLWMSMSGGLSWWEIERLFLLISPSWALIFALFEAIMLLAMMNIVTGIFVNDAVEMAAMDRELRTQTEKTRIYTLMENLKGMFRDVDTDESGTISLEELRSYLQDEEVRTLLMMMDIEVPDCVSFFEILDVDGNGTLEIDEFVIGCMNLKGDAKMVALATTTRDLNKGIKKCIKHLAALEGRISVAFLDLFVALSPLGVSPPPEFHELWSAEIEASAECGNSDKTSVETSTESLE